MLCPESKAQTIAPCPPAAGSNSIDLSNQLGLGYNTSSKLFDFRTSGTFLDAGITPAANNWWLTVVAPTWYGGAYGTNTSNNQFTAQNYPAQNTGTEIRITGDFIVDQSISIQYSELKMSAGAKITVKPGKLLDLRTCWIHYFPTNDEDGLLIWSLQIRC
ncbi:MAG: hypothetical protein U0Y08_15285 [Bacteroidia bacterium]